MDYTFHGSYNMLNDTLLITLKDDSHSEDNGNVDYFRIKYLVKQNVLYVIGHGELTRGKWRDVKIKLDKSTPFKRTPRFQARLLGPERCAKATRVPRSDCCHVWVYCRPKREARVLSAFGLCTAHPAPE